MTLIANPAEGYSFVRWEGDVSGDAASVSVGMASAKNVTAVFKKVYVLNVSVSPNASGSVFPGSGVIDENTVIALTAVPASGYRFLRWEGDASGNTTSINVTMNSAKTVTAIFKKVYTLTTYVNPAGSGSVSPGSGSFDENSVLIVVATPASTYRFDHWEGDVSGNVTSANITISTTRNVTAFFAKLTP